MASLPLSLVCLMVLDVLISVLGAFGNALVLLAVVKNRSLQTVPDLFIFSMAVADLIVTAVQIPMLTTRISRLYTPNYAFNSVLGSIGFLAILASITSMFIVTIDRFVAIQHPFMYIRLATKKRAAQAIGTLWILCLAYTVTSSFLGQIKYYIVWTYMSILLISTVIMYVYLFFTARKQQNKINTLGPTINNPTQKDVNVPPRRGQRNERKPAKTIAIVVGVFIGFWVPFLVYVITDHNLKENEPNTMILFFWFFSLSLWNSSLNPYIYCVRNSRYRLAFVRILHLKQTVQMDSSFIQSNVRPTNPNVGGHSSRIGEVHKKSRREETLEEIEA